MGKWLYAAAAIAMLMPDVSQAKKPEIPPYVESDTTGSLRAIYDAVYPKNAPLLLPIVAYSARKVAFSENASSIVATGVYCDVAPDSANVRPNPAMALYAACQAIEGAQLLDQGNKLVDKRRYSFEQGYCHVDGALKFTAELSTSGRPRGPRCIGWEEFTVTAVKPGQRTLESASFVALRRSEAEANRDKANFEREAAARAARERPRKIMIGAAICRSINGSYYEGYTEAYAPQTGKIQVRVVRARSEGFRSWDENYRSEIIWESPDLWTLCERM